MMYRTELVEGITVENVIEKINAKIEEMEKESYRLVTMSFWGTERAVLVFKKGLKGSFHSGRKSPAAGWGAWRQISCKAR